MDLQRHEITLFNLLWIWFLLMVWMIAGLILVAALGLRVGLLWWGLAGFGLFRWRQWARKELHARKLKMRAMLEARTKPPSPHG